MKRRFFAPLLAVILLLSACSTSPSEKAEVEYPQLTNKVQKNEQVVEMETSMGTIKIKLFPEYAPKAVENFITHSKNGYYDGVIFHRVMNDFMIQGGDPEGTGMGGESIYGQPFEDEFSDKLFHIRGALSMAKPDLPDSNGSQFFIVQNSHLDPDYKGEMEQAGYPTEIIEAYEKGGTPWLDHKHTVFGQVIEGMDIVDKIASVEIGAINKPVEDVVIKKIKVK
ncbi:peptidylprolyl isomerase [Bacillus sp. Bva_UNVM-123]|uniref:peptidylprolyl isomerase n=1 Tax=Bacillus sp. Bva_UNVM-123 TaxID=2829798 RepID=UPI00391F7B20